MARKQTWNLGKLNAELAAADDAIAPILVSAKITSLTVAGVSTPASDAPLPNRIAAIGSLLSTGDKTVDHAELIASNGQLATQVEGLENKLSVATASGLAQSQRISTLESEQTISSATVATLTAKNTELTSLLAASNHEASRLNAVANQMKQNLAQDALDAGCLSIEGAETPAAKLEAAMKMSSEDLRAAYKGAVNSAMTRLGVSASTNLPGAAAPKTITGSNLQAQFAAITDPTERVRFYRANKDAIDASFRE